MTNLLKTMFSIAAAFTGLNVAAGPAVGEAAPDFTLQGSDGQAYTLSEMRGQHVVIAFFPKAFTSG